jgi:hypothetical protein
VAENGRFVRRFPMWELPCWPHAGEFQTAQSFADEKATYEVPIRLLNECIGDLLLIEKAGNHWSFAYSALSCFSIGMSGSASFQMVRKSW